MTDRLDRLLRNLPPPRPTPNRAPARRGGRDVHRESAARARVLEFIETYHAAYGFVPAYRVIADGVGLMSSSTVYYHIVALVAAGRLVQHGKRLALVTPGPEGLTVEHWKTEALRYLAERNTLEAKLRELEGADA